MNDDIMTAAYEDDEPILPEGWQEGDDLFAGEDDWLEGNSEEPETPPQEDQPPAEEPDEGAPTPEQPPEDGGEAEGEGGQAPTPEPETPPEPRKLKFTARVDREDRDVEVDEGELPTLYQKAQVVDRVQAKLAKLTPALEKAEQLSKRLGYADLDAMLAAAEDNYRSGEVQRLVAEGVHEEVAKDMVEHRLERNAAQAAREEAQAQPEETTQPEGEPAPAKGRDFQAEVRALMEARPDLQTKRIPEEVVQACVRGKPLLAAYAEYEVKQERAEAEKLRRENAILKQNAQAAARAPVNGTEGAPAPSKPEDDFLKGFNAEDY